MEGKINKDGILELRVVGREFEARHCVMFDDECGVHCPNFPDDFRPDERGQYSFYVCEGDLVFDKFTDERIAE